MLHAVLSSYHSTRLVFPHSCHFSSLLADLDAFEQHTAMQAAAVCPRVACTPARCVHHRRTFRVLAATREAHQQEPAAAPVSPTAPTAAPAALPLLPRLRAAAGAVALSAALTLAPMAPGALEAHAQSVVISNDTPVIDLARVVPRDRLEGLQQQLLDLERCAAPRGGRPSGAALWAPMGPLCSNILPACCYADEALVSHGRTLACPVQCCTQPCALSACLPWLLAGPILAPLCSETGWRVRMLTRFGPSAEPSVEEIRAGWTVDDRTIVIFVDPTCEPASLPA